MTLACVRRPTCEARSAAREASPMTYTPAWKYRTTWRGSIPSTVISAVGTPPSAAAVTVTSAGGSGAGTHPPPGGAQGRSRGHRSAGSPLLVDSAVDREGRLSQDCVEVLSLLGAHGGSPFGW